MNKGFLLLSIYLLLSSAAQGQFSEAEVLDACLPCTPTDITTADLDGDGDNDLLIAGESKGEVAWSRNDGDGNFTSPSLLLPYQGNTRAVQSADFNQDGLLDLLVATSDTRYGIRWAANEGNMRFSEPIQVSAAAVPATDIDAVDLDGDGWLDVVASNSREVFWFRNEEGESFSAQRLILEGLLQNQGFATGDLDGDGHIDIFIPAEFAAFGGYAWGRNDGNGNFTLRPVPANLGTSNIFPSFSWGIGDMDNDGDLDLINVTFFQGALFWNRNDGNGNFSMPIIITGGTPIPGRLDLADTDLDGDLDIVLPNRLAGQAVIYINDGAGEITTAYVVAENLEELRTVHVSDLNGDELPDIAAVSADDDEITVLLNEDDNFFESVNVHDVAYADLQIVQSADMNDDGYLDLLVYSRGESKLAYLPYEVDSHTFGQEIMIGRSADPHTILSDDYNGDGKTDLVTVDQQDGATTLYRNFNNRLFIKILIDTIGTRYAESNGNSYLTDLNADSKLDMIIVSGRTIDYHLQLDGAQLGPAQTVSTWELGNITTELVHMDADEFQDLVINYELEGRIEVRFGSSLPSFTTSQDLLQLDTTIKAFKLLDVDQDSYLDLLILSQKQLWLHRNNGDNTFEQTGTLLSPNIAQVVDLQLIDVNKDNRPDVVFFQQPTSSDPDGEVWALLNLSDATLAPPSLLTSYTMPGEAGNFYEGAFLADFGNDNDPDLVFYQRRAVYLGWQENLHYTVSTEEPLRAPSLSVYPNPFRKQVQLRGEPALRAQVGSVRLYTPSGQLLGSVELDTRRQVALPNDLPPGMYFLACRNRAGLPLQTIPIVKQ